MRKSSLTRRAALLGVAATLATPALVNAATTARNASSFRARAWNDYFDDRYWHNGKKTQYEGFCTDVWFDNAARFIEQSTAAGKPFFCYIPTNIAHGPYYAPEKYSDMYAEKPNPPRFGAITHFDQCVGKLRTMLREKGLSENTIFIFTTDNGSPGGITKIFNAGMRGGKGSPYDGGHRVPCFIYWPDGKLIGGRDVGQLSARRHYHRDR